MTRQRFDAERLEAFASQVFAALGLADADARRIAADLVAADLRNVGSHGIARIPLYVERLRAGLVNPRPNVRIEAVTPVVASVDGDHGFGFVVGHRAMDRAIEMARESGIALAGIRHSTHFGMAALYVQQALDAGLLALVFTNSSPAVPVWGSRGAFLGSAPFAAGAPGGRHGDYLLDMAMSVTARGKIKLAAQRGEAIPEGLALDAEGRPTTDAAAAFAGVCLPFGGAKGAGLAMLMDILCGVLTGAGYAGGVGNPHRDFDRPQDVGHFMLAIRPDLFMSESEFRARMDTLVERARAQPLAAGVDEILIPGEPERRSHARHLVDGVALDEQVRAQLEMVAAQLGIAPPRARAH